MILAVHGVIGVLACGKLRQGHRGNAEILFVNLLQETDDDWL
jgi:hypothetical protein